MTKEEKNTLKDSIQKEIQTLLSELKNLEPKLHPVKKDCSLDNAAYASLMQEHNIATKRYQMIQKRLEELHNIVTKLDTPEYGICQECEEKIPLERLKLVPHSPYCVACLEELGL